MFLIPPAALEGKINTYYTTWRRDSVLLGYFPCENTEEIWCKYYSVGTLDEKHRVVPVFYVPDMVFDGEPEYAVPGHALFFLGCDDGHLGLKFEEKHKALQWIDDCPYVDFNQLYIAYTHGKVDLLFHN
jgi:hypothetical protein